MTSDKKPFRKIFSTIILSFMFFFINGCDTTETTNGTVSLSFHSGSSLQKITDGTIELTEVKILLRDVKLKMDDDEDDDGHNGEGEHENGDDNSHMIRVGPFVVNLNLNGMTTDFIVANIPAGYYEGVKFKIHQIQGSEVPPDPEFKEGEDNSKRYSVIVKGLYNSEPFIYKSKKPAKQHLEFEPPIFVEENGDINLTITVDPYSWFYKDEILLDPTDPANENDIDNNIKASFKEAYEDDDHNGKED
jgi:hypothetical protein